MPHLPLEIKRVAYIRVRRDKYVIENSPSMVSGFRRVVNEIFALLGCYAA
jgi:hypothetical protein